MGILSSLLISPFGVWVNRFLLRHGVVRASELFIACAQSEISLIADLLQCFKSFSSVAFCQNASVLFPAEMELTSLSGFHNGFTPSHLS
jgi:hypothetical protein